MTTRTLALGVLIALGCAPDPTLFGATAEGTAGGSGGGEGGEGLDSTGATEGATSSDETTGAAVCLDDCAGEVLWTRELDEWSLDMAIEADGTPVLVTWKLGQTARIVRHRDDGSPSAEILDDGSGSFEAVAVGGPTVVSVDPPGDATELRQVGADGLGAVWARTGEHEGQGSPSKVSSAADGWTHVAGTERAPGGGSDRAWVDVFAPDGALSSTWTRDFDAGSIDGWVSAVVSREGGAFDVVLWSHDGGAEFGTLIRVTAQGAEGASVTLSSSMRAVLPRGEGFTVMGYAEGGVSLGELDAELELAGPVAVDPLPPDTWPQAAVAIPDGTLVATMRLGPPVSLALRRYDATGALVGITTVAPASPTSSPTWAQLAARGDAVYMLGEDSDDDGSLGWLRRIGL